MKPDLPLNKIRLPHYKTDSFQDICKMINILSIADHSLGDKKKLFIFSLNLGIILHYIADFFCEAHNFQPYNHLSKHLNYERILSRRFENIKTSDLKNMVKRFKNPYIAAPKTTLGQYINDRHFEYLNTERSYDTDLQYSLIMCINVAYGILSASSASERFFDQDTSEYLGA
jgi:hypothetical protein